MTPKASIAINGAALREIRIRTGVAAVKLAKQLGISKAYMSQLEHGRRDRVSPELFVALCKALNIEDQRALRAAPASSDDDEDADGSAA
jgi:transcriptional regulator with XRE-family HTH domain